MQFDQQRVRQKKKDRMLALAHELKLAVVLFAEGGGGDGREMWTADHRWLE
ncbi:hypothetical protein [Bradyrhizobium macuxiense]|uniref:hypothetical protein n=1 Tax=Bradyrhizobium macuxiense TaxID=1755647 RepID=UPI001917F2CC|nr:hypothetical protein [Bradyrhizobium macuxiense]